MVRMAFTALGTGFVFLFLAFSSRSIVALIPILGLGLLLWMRGDRGEARRVRHVFLSPFLPFALLASSSAFFVEKITDALWMATIALVYVCARIVRATVNLVAIALALFFTGVVLQTVRVLSTIQFAEVGFLFSKLADYNHKNPAGWAIGLGLVALASILSARSHTNSVFWLLSFGVALGATLLLYSNSAAALISAMVSLITILVPVVVFHRTSIDKRAHWLRIALLAVAAVVISLFILFTLGRGVQGASLPVLQRDAGLTGRTKIWSCYFDAINAGQSDLWSYTSDCFPGDVANLHSSFLEAHLTGGWVLSIALFLGFLVVMVGALFSTIRARKPDARLEAVFSLGISTFGLLLATVESYFFSGFIYASFVMFLAPSSPTSVSIPVHAMLKSIRALVGRAPRGHQAD